MRPDEQDHFPFRPVTDPVHLAKNDAEEKNLSPKPQDFHDHPEQKVRFETHLANERVAQHDSVDFEIASHDQGFLPPQTVQVNCRKLRSSKSQLGCSTAVEFALTL